MSKDKEFVESSLLYSSIFYIVLLIFTIIVAVFPQYKIVYIYGICIVSFALYSVTQAKDTYMGFFKGFGATEEALKKQLKPFTDAVTNFQIIGGVSIVIMLGLFVFSLMNNSTANNKSLNNTSYLISGGKRRR